jgi:hypothetical protein
MVDLWWRFARAAVNERNKCGILTRCRYETIDYGVTVISLAFAGTSV